MNTRTHEPFDRLRTTTHAIIPQEELIKKLSTGKKLKIKLGADPTAPDLHLGHTVVLSKMKEFQELGHEVIFLIGDFTARIGDPTGRSKTRPPLSPEQIEQNSITYLDQVGRILDRQRLTVAYNSQWLDQLTSKDWVRLCGHVTVARIIEREDFAQRLAQHQSIGFHELLYPILQAYDSVVLQADVELGGTDQTFNLLMGRYLQEQYDQEPQVVITMPLLLGLDGTAKMSKSLGNAIGLTEPADQAFGKLMSLSDELMWHYYELLLNKTPQELARMQEGVLAGRLHPMQLKKELAYTIIQRFWSKEEADYAQQAFEHRFQQKDFDYAVSVELPATTPNPLWIVDLLKLLGALTTSSEAKRLINDGAVTINDIKIKDFAAQIELTPAMNVKVGKTRFYKIHYGS